MTNSLNKHGDTDRMVSRKIEDLSSEDLSYLEKLLGEKLAAEIDADSIWKAKNHYERKSDHKKRLLRLMDAIRSQKRLTKVAHW